MSDNWVDSHYTRVVSFLEQKFNASPRAFFNFSDVCTEFETVIKSEPETAFSKLFENRTQSEMEHFLLTGKKTIQRSVNTRGFFLETSRRANAVYRLQIRIPEEYRAKFGNRVKYDDEGRIVEFISQQGSVRLGELTTPTLVDYMRELSFASLRARTIEELADQFLHSGRPECSTPIVKSHLMKRLNEVIQNILNEPFITEELKVRICMMTRTPIPENSEKILSTLAIKTDSNRIVVGYKFSNRLTTKTYTLKRPTTVGRPTSSQGPSTSNWPVSTKMPVKVIPSSGSMVQRRGFNVPVTSQLKNTEEKMKIDEREMNNYFKFLEELSLSQVSPWTDSEIVQEYYSSRNKYPVKITNLAEKIQSLHSNIVNADIFDIRSRVVMLYFTQTTTFQLFDRSAWAKAHIQCFDKDTEWRLISVKIVDSSSKEIFVERESEYIVSINAAKEINPLPWATIEVKHLLEHVYFETRKARNFLNLTNVCKKFKELSDSRRSVEQLVAKAEQHLKAKNVCKITEVRKKWLALYRLQTTLYHQFLRNCPEKLIYQQNQQNQLVYLKSPFFFFGTFDEHIPYNESLMLTDIMKLIQSVSVSRLTDTSDDDCASRYENEHRDRFTNRQYTVKCVSDAYFLVELDDRSSIFSKTHTVFLNDISVSPAFQTRAMKYNTCSFEKGKITGYMAENVFVHFDSDGRCFMEKKDVHLDHQTTHKSVTIGKAMNCQLNKESSSLLNCLLRVLGVELCRLSMDKLHTYCEQFGFPSNDRNFFIKMLNKLKTKIESLDHLGLFTQLRLLFLTGTSASDDFKRRTKHYKVVWSENGYALKFEAFVNLMMIRKQGEQYGILNDITLARANNEYVQEGDQPIQEEGESSTAHVENSSRPVDEMDNSGGGEQRKNDSVHDEPNVYDDYVDDVQEATEATPNNEPTVRGEFIEDTDEEDQSATTHPSTSFEKAEDFNEILGHGANQETIETEDVQQAILPCGEKENDYDEDETDVSGDHLEHQNDNSDDPDFDYDVPEQDEQPIQEEGEGSDEEHEEDLLDDRPNPIVQRDAAHVDDDPRSENDSDEEEADVSGNQLEHQNDNFNHDEHFDDPEDSNQERVDSPERVLGNEDSVNAEMPNTDSLNVYYDHQEDSEQGISDEPVDNNEMEQDAEPTEEQHSDGTVEISNGKVQKYQDTTVKLDYTEGCERPDQIENTIQEKDPEEIETVSEKATSLKRVHQEESSEESEAKRPKPSQDEMESSDDSRSSNEQIVDEDSQALQLSSAEGSTSSNNTPNASNVHNSSKSSEPSPKERPEQNEDTAQGANPEEMDTVSEEASSRKRVHQEESSGENEAKRPNDHSSKSTEPSPRKSSNDQSSISRLNESSPDSSPDRPLSTISTLEILTIIQCNLPNTREFKAVGEKMCHELASMKDNNLAVNDVLLTLDHTFQCLSRSVSITENTKDTVSLSDVLKMFAELARKFRSDPEIGQFFKRITEKIGKLLGREQIPISEFNLVMEVWIALCAENGGQIKHAEQPSLIVEMPTRKFLLNWLKGFVKTITPGSDDILKEIQLQLNQKATSQVKIESDDLLRAFQLGFRLSVNFTYKENDSGNSVRLSSVILLFVYLLNQLELPILHQVQEDIKKFQEIHKGTYWISNKHIRTIERAFLTTFTLQPLEN